jgi:hypothetical protein
VNDEHREARDDLIAEICKAVKTELWHEFLLAGIATPPDYWSDGELAKMAARLRAVADDMDPPEGVPRRDLPSLYRIPQPKRAGGSR